MKKPQWITLGIAVLLTAGIFLFARTTPFKKAIVAEQHGPDDGHNHAAGLQPISIDTILNLARKRLTQDQIVKINTLENSITRGAVKDQQLHVYHQLARFWADTIRAFEPYAWYNGEAARLENSEKSLTFAAQLFLDNLQSDEETGLRQWKALQAKDLFERSLKINPDNDSAKVGLGACYLFGGISDMPMEGISKIKQVVDKDSTNIYAQMMLVRGSLVSGQYEKAISRLKTVNSIKPDDLDAILLLAEVYERTGDKTNAISWYQQSLPFVKLPEAKAAIRERIAALKK